MGIAGLPRGATASFLPCRLTGGGSILMGPGQLGLALAPPRAAVSTAGGFGAGVRGAERRHRRGAARRGVESVLRPKNDLAVGGRKICGVDAYTDAAGMLLFTPPPR
jgi:lipoate-protein ligase A